MRFGEMIQTTQEEIFSKKWNIYLGISIQNKYFTEEHIKLFADWATEYTKHQFAIVLVDAIQYINNEVLNHSSRLAAIDKAFRKSDQLREMCQGVIRTLPEEKRTKIVLIDWVDIIETDYYLFNHNLIEQSIRESDDFQEFLLRSTTRNLGSIVDRLNPQDIEKLTRYFILELPEVLTGFLYNGTHFNLNMYPGKLASLAQELLCQDFFAETKKKLRYIGDYAAVEAYVD